VTLSPTSGGNRDCVEGTPRRWYLLVFNAEQLRRILAKYATY
jgi:hypothetical protein